MNGLIIHMNKARAVKSAKAVRLEADAPLLLRGVMEVEGVSMSGRGLGVDGVLPSLGNGNAMW